MDELLHHCIRELAFDGDLGCSVNRLQDFIIEFYAHSGAEQTVDEAYCAFVWSVVVQHPEVRVGVAPEGGLEVYIAPQAAKVVQRKQKGKATEEAEQNKEVAQLELVEDAALRSLDDLKQEYGDKLRIAVDPDRSLVAITGSHIKSSKMTPMVYTALQLISRGREAGLSAVDLSKKTGYDAKTCHYLIEKLVELNLIVKRKKPGVGTNFSIHKYFFDRNKFWQDVLATEGGFQRPAVKKEEEDNLDSDEDDEDGQSLASTSAIGLLQFEPIDSRHLSSLALIKDRVEKLLRNSPYHTHVLQNLIVTIGFSNPVKSDRRFFQTRLKELIAQGFIERVRVPRLSGGSVSCIRLVDPDEQAQAQTAPEVTVLDDAVEPSSLKTNITLQRQIVDLIHQSGTEGATLNQISDTLGSLDKRTLDFQLNRLKDSSLPGHVRDLGITQVSESHGRERRYKYFTFANYQKIVEKEKLKSPYPDGFFDNVGEFLSVDEDEFYRTDAELSRYVTGRIRSVKGKGKERASTMSAARGTKRDRGEVNAEDDVALAEGEASTSMAPPPPKRKRGRPPKNRPPEPVTPVDNAAQMDDTSSAAQVEALPPPTPAPAPAPARKRGRPRKNPDDTLTQKRRGRPPKNGLSTSQAGPPGPVLQPHAPPDAGTESSIVPQDVETPLPVDAFTEAAPVTETATAISLVPANQQESDLAIVLPEPRSEFPSASAVQETAPTLEPSIQASEDIEPAIVIDLTTEVTTDHTKRPASGTPPSEPPTKRLRASASAANNRARTNLSQARREKEILRLITELGGIANTSVKEFTEGHAALLERMVAAGEAISVAIHGAKLDKKTLDATLRALADQGFINIVTTSVQSRQVRVAHLADKPQEEVNAFLANLSKPTPATTNQSSSTKMLAATKMHGGTSNTQVARPQDTLVFVEQIRPAEPHATSDLSALSETKLREVLLIDPQTVKQLYGFILGKMARLAEFHLHVMQLFDENTNPYVVASDQRIFDTSYFFEDIPISLYCVFVSSEAPNDELKSLLSTPDGRATPLSRLSPSLKHVLEPGKSRSRARILDLLVTLQEMHVVTPLLPTNSENPWLRCPPNGDHPTAFDITHCDKTASLQAPQYWRFNPSVPIHLWTLHDTTPPFWMDASCLSRADAESFWRNMKWASLDVRHARRLVEQWQQDNQPPVGPAAEIPVRIVKLMRRNLQWCPSYSFSDNQKHVLKWHTNLQTASTPLEDPDGGDARLSHISDLVSAPKDEVAQFYRTERDKMLRDIEKVEKKSRPRGKKAEVPERNDGDQRANLAQKAAEARTQREREWKEMLLRVHPDPLEDAAVIRMKKLRTRFLQATGTDYRKWEAEIASAIEQSKILAEHSTAHGLPLVSFNPAQPGVPHLGRSHEKSVEELIELQGPAIDRQEPTPQSKKGKEKDGADGKVIRRRHRFAWTKDFEELARDASAIIRARSRDSKRLDWAALEQVFRAIPRNTARQRIVLLREQPGADAYLKRLEDKWYEVWTKHRGTPELPDDDPASTWNFDLIAHITFLRAHIDKNALRVGFVESTEDVPIVALPSSTSALESQFRVSEKPPLAPTYEFMWNNAAEEGREKLLAQQPFMLAASPDSCVAQGLQMRAYPSERSYVGDAALKMTLGTPKEAYDADRAADLLKSAGQEAVDIAVKDMLERGVVSKLVRDAQNKPGRTLKISDQNQNAIGGPISTELFQDALALEEGLCSAQHEDPLSWRTWPLTASDGDIAALLELVSEDKIDFQIDTSGPQSVRAGIDWNSKKADDDDIETTIRLRCRKDFIAVDTATSHPATNGTTSKSGDYIVRSPLEANQEIGRDRAVPTFMGPQQIDHDHPLGMSGMLTLEHGKILNGERASCRLELAGVIEDDITEVNNLVNCQACLDSEVAKVSDGDGFTLRLWAMVVAAGERGVAKHKLKMFAEESTKEQVVDAITRLIAHKLVFWAGYKNIVLVSAHFLSSWTVRTQLETVRESQEERSNQESQPSPVDMKVTATKPLLTIFPRRWLDVNGRQVPELWESACRAVIGIVVFRPGVNQAELRWRLRSVYDRLELHDILMHLLDCKHLKVMRSESIFITDSPADDAEERQTFWFIGEKRWYDM